MANEQLNIFVKHFTNLIKTCNENATEWIKEKQSIEIIHLNKGQLWDGDNIYEQDIRPYYSENPYFKSRESAERYANWKQAITKNPKRPKDVPNLYINGYFYNTLELKKDIDSFEVVTNNSLGQEITSVHKNVLGLTQKNSDKINEKYVMPFFFEFVTQQLKV